MRRPLVDAPALALPDFFPVFISFVLETFSELDFGGTMKAALWLK